MATAGTATQTINNYQNRVITITGVTSGNTSPAFSVAGFPYTSWVATNAGTAPTSVTAQGSNDAGTTWIADGAAVTTLPGGAVLGAFGNNAVFGLYRFLVTGGDGTTLVNVNIIAAAQTR